MGNEVPKGGKRKMIQVPNKEDIEKGKVLHDKIKAHPFRLEPQLYLLDEYDELINNISRLFSRYSELGVDENYRTLYKYHRLEFVTEKIKDVHGNETEYENPIDIWSNPTIALINEAMHDYRELHISLKLNWDNDFLRKKFLEKYIETSEKLLQLLHRVIKNEITTELSFPKTRFYEKEQTIYKYVQNPKYNNDWTLEYFL